MSSVLNLSKWSCLTACVFKEFDGETNRKKSIYYNNILSTKTTTVWHSILLAK